MTAQQLRVYAQEFRRVLDRQQALNRDVVRQNEELRGRITELVSLYRFIQDHLMDYFEVVAGFQKLARRFSAIQSSDPAIAWKSKEWLLDFRAQCNEATAFLQSYKTRLAESVNEETLSAVEQSSAVNRRDKLKGK